jgi:hypothetical protein
MLSYTLLQNYKFDNWIRILSGSRSGSRFGSLTLLLTYVYIEKCEKKIFIDVFLYLFWKTGGQI